MAVLVRLLGDYNLAEESLQEAFTIALQKWSKEGLPENPGSWLISTAKYKAIDMLRRSKRGKELLMGNYYPETATQPEFPQPEHSEDDQLRLIFLCCHPLLPLDSRIALALRDVCGMTTEEIARAYLLPSETIKKRISRAKTLFRDKKIPFEMPSGFEQIKRLNAVLHVIYLIFNEGYVASRGKQHIREDLSDEAIFLCRNLVTLWPSTESMGLLALLLLQEARRKSRRTEKGDLIPLEQQDRSQWDQKLIAEGLQLIQQAIMSGRLGPYTLQAAIASVHAVANSVDNTRWDLIIHYYDILLAITPSAIVSLNRAIAVGMHDGPKAALLLIDNLLKEGQLNNHHLVYAARADFFKRLGQKKQAIKAYKKAIELAGQEPQQRYLKKQLATILK